MVKLKTESIKARIETDRHVIVGTVHPPSIAYRSRLSDLINQKDISFLSVTGADIYGAGQLEAPIISAAFLAVNLRKVEMITPVEE